MRSALLVLLTLLAGCGGDDPASCRDDGGRWECKDATLTECRCATKTSDGGQTCTDSGECDARCILKQGVCGDVKQLSVCEQYHTRYDCPTEVVHGECTSTCE